MIVTAKRPFFCNECRMPILAGDKYELKPVGRATFNGPTDAVRRCVTCANPPGDGLLPPHKEEHTIWMLLCQVLRDTCAVKQSDLDAPSSEMDTKGKRLLALIRRWGEAKVRLEMHSEAMESER